MLTGISTDNNGEDDNTADAVGAVYLFSRSGDIWSQQAYVKAPNTDVNDKFGSSVALSNDGNTLAVGATATRSVAGINLVCCVGVVYLFSRSGAAWSQQAYIKASNIGFDDFFSFPSVALSSDGNILAVGISWEGSTATGISSDGSGEGDNTAIYAGAVYFFSRSGDIWSKQAYVKASNAESGEKFGISVALSDDGNTLAVGANWENSNELPPFQLTLS